MIRALERSRLIRENRSYQKNLEEEVEKRTAELQTANHELNQTNLRLRQIVHSTQSISAYKNVTELGKQMLEEFGRHMRAGGGSVYILENNRLVHLHSLDPGHAVDNLALPLKSGTVFQRILETRAPGCVDGY